eukprot:Seg93.2 transcript_id=Seg93.2/GoldUCD/mRNA.D3Y31 product="Zinc finger and BTB domain-containing protein 24" protein_id=Seg93.2/GoldUCD/D3Y31
MRFHSHFCLYLHLTVHSKVKAGWFQCGICRKRFESLVNYIKHRSRHGNGRSQNKKLDGTEPGDIDHRTEECEEGKGGTPSFQMMKEDVSSEHGEFPCNVNTVTNPEQKKKEEAKRNAFAIKFVEQLKNLLKLNEDTNDLLQEDKTESLQFSEVTSSNIPHDGVLSPSLSSPLSENAQEWQGNSQDQYIKNLNDPGRMVCETKNNVMDCEPEYNVVLAESKIGCEKEKDEISAINNSENENTNISAENEMDCEPENNQISAENEMDCEPENNQISAENEIDCGTENGQISAMNRIDCITEQTNISPESNQILAMDKTDCEPENNQISAENEMDCGTENDQISAMNRNGCVAEQTKTSPESRKECQPESNQGLAMDKIECETEQTNIPLGTTMKFDPENNQISAGNEMDCGTENKEILAESDAHSFNDKVTESEDNNLCMSTSDGRMSPKCGASANMENEGDEKETENSRHINSNRSMENFGNSQPTISNESTGNIGNSRPTNSTEIKKETDNSRPSKSDRSKSSSFVARKKRASFTCFLCNAKFSGYALLYKHKIMEHQIAKTKSVKGASNMILDCLVCKMKFSTYWELYSHRKSAHKSKSSRTPPNQLSGKKQKIKHEVTSVKEEKVSLKHFTQNELKLKDEKITSVEEENLSLKKLQPEKQKADVQSQVDQPYQCRFCLDIFTSFSGLSQHMRKTHKCYRRLDKDKNLFKRENLGPDNDSSNELLKQDAIDLAANHLGPTSFGRSGDASLLDCTLCRATFFTYGGLKGHLRTKHNVGVVVKPKDSEPGREDDTKDANSASKGESSVQINKVPEGVKKADIEDSSAYSKSPSLGKEDGDGYISDNNKLCKKCDKSYGSVKNRRQHALKSHGLEVSFEGDKFVFVEYNFSGDAKTGQHEVKRGVDHAKSAADCSAHILKCNLCSSEYTKWRSYQKHMSKKHQIKKTANDRRMMSATATHTVSKSFSDLNHYQEAVGEDGTSKSFTATKNGTFRNVTGVASTTYVRTDSAKVRPGSVNLPMKDDEQYSSRKLQSKELPECATVSRRPENVESPSSLLTNERNERGSREDVNLEASLWRTDLTKKKFDCLICGSSFAGFRVQRMHMLEYHNIRLDKNGKRIKPQPTKRKGVDTSFDKYRKKMFASFNDEVASNGEESSSEESKNVDSGMSDTEDGASSQTEQTSNSVFASPDKNNKGKYLCPQCPMDFVTLIDRHIHMKDTHRKIQELQRQTHEKSFETRFKTFPLGKSMIDSEYTSRGSRPVSPCFESDEDEEVAASFKEDTAKSAPATKQYDAAKGRMETNATKADHTIQIAVKIESDSQLKPYVCGYCDKAHSTCGSLMQHFEEAHHTRPKNSAERSKYTNQQNSCYHDRDKPFVCGICNTRMSVRRSIQQHLRKKHNMILQNYRARKSVTPPKKGPQNENEHADTVRSSLRAISINEAEKEPARNQGCDDPMVLSTDTEDEKMNGKYSPVPPGDDTEDDDQCYDNIDNTLRNLFDLALMDCNNEPGASTVTRSEVGECDSNNKGAISTALDFNSNAKSTALTPCIERHDDPDKDSLSKSDSIPDLIMIDVNSVKQEFPVDHVSNNGAKKVQLREEIVVIDSSEDEEEEVNVVDTDNDLGNMPSLISIEQIQDAAEEVQQDAVEIQPEDSTETTIFKCSVCNIELPSSQQLQLHKMRMSHHSEFVCKIAGCGKEFSSKRSYNDHIKHRCSLCHKRLSSTQKVKRHIREVHKIKDPLTCDVCGEEFVEPISLAYHNREQHMTEQVL